MQDEEKFTAKDVAQWMVDEIGGRRHLYQSTAAHQIERMFGDEFVYTNPNGNLAITKGVLKEFNKLTGDSVVWARKKFAWRPREEWDGPGRQQRSLD